MTGPEPGGDSARWRLVEAFLDELLEIPEADARRARLTALAAEDPRLASEVGAFLDDALRTGGDLLDRPLAISVPALLGDVEGADGRAGDDPLAANRTIDRYRLLEVLGRGGMGVVYLAERADAQFEKRVALKLLPYGLETPERARRFRAERQILARLEHPGIARLLDGGVTGEGYPYLVMEWIDGEPLDRYCEQERLPVRARLELFLEVCAAVQYAHGHLVVHRDLKPGNILVTRDGRAKLLDFGVAKMLDEEEGAPPTRVRALTPDYASPEQAADLPVTTASDIYSLGVVLYRLLTGVTPARLARAAESSPITSRVTPPGRAAEEAARLGLEANAASGLAARAWSDLDLIVLKAIEHDPRGRYVSAAALAEDVRRYLDGLPISARAPSRRYRFARFVSRHRTASALAVAAVLLLGSGLGAILWQARVAALERDRARTSAARAERVAEFVGRLFDAASPTSAGAGQGSLREILDLGEAHLRPELASEPAVRGKLLEVLASAHSALGDHERATNLAREAVADLRRVEPTDAPALASALITLAAVQIGQGGSAGSETVLREAQSLLEAANLGESRAMARLLHNRGLLRTRAGDEERAVELHREALRLWRAHGSEADAAAELTALAGRLDALGRPDEALELKRQALDSLRRIYGDEHPHVLSTRNNIAFSLHIRGRYREAEAIYREVLAGVEALVGADSSGFGDPLSNLGKVLMDQGRFEEAAEHVRRATEIRRRTLDANHPARIAAEMNLASLELALGDADRAVDLYRSGLERFERLAGADSPGATRCRSLLGTALHRAGRPAAAEAPLRAALARQRAGGRPLDLADTLAGLGATLSDLGREGEALPLVQEALALRLAALPAEHWTIAELRIELGGLLFRSGSPVEAREALAAGTASLETLPGHDWAKRRARRFAAEVASRDRT